MTGVYGSEAKILIIKKWKKWKNYWMIMFPNINEKIIQSDWEKPIAT